MIRRVSYELYLVLHLDSWETVDRLEAATSGPGFVPVTGGRRRGWLGERAPQAYLRDPEAVLSGDAALGEEAFSLTPDGREALARTVLAIHGVLGDGWALRSSWVGDAIEHEPTVSAEELAGLVRRSALRRDTMYWVGRQPEH
jgi:hypothetical protein